MATTTPTNQGLKLGRHASWTEDDAILATRYRHIVTVENDAAQVEAAHGIDDLRQPLLPECVNFRLIERSGK
jgi:hypothetical protein